jgi:tRNA(Ile)-lysidine synthase
MPASAPDLIQWEPATLYQVRGTNMVRPPPLGDRVRRCLTPLEGAAAGLVVAVSGGVDSVALARAAVEARCGPLVLAHLNHQLRGADSDADEAFVVGLAASLPGVRLCVERLDVGGQARREGENLEAAARRLRYQWLAEVARREGVRWVATGHTADDQAETVLHRLLRGAGLKGLRGIAPRRPLDGGVSVVRPLLTTTRIEVIAYLLSLDQPFREDVSNRDLRLTRNRIRHELLPQLRSRYNPAIVSVLGRLAAQAEEAFAEVESQIRLLLQQSELPRAGALCILDRERLAAAPRYQVREALRLLWAREGWPMGAMGYAEWNRLAGLVFGESVAADLPGGVRARLRGRVLQLGRH